jgi:phage-related minor tail protein
LLLAIITGPFGLALYGIYKFKDSIIAVLLGIKTFAATIFDNIIGAYRTVMNGVLGLMESGINKAISGLNTALDAIDAAAGPLVNFGSVPNISIPRLADGGIVTAPTLALIGEAGPEAVIPLNRANGMGGNNITINVQGADPNAVVQALQRYVRQSGPVPVNIRAM